MSFDFNTRAARRKKTPIFTGWIALCAILAGCTTYPVHRMAEHGNIRGIQSYLKGGGDINQSTKRNWVSGGSENLTPLHFAILGEQLKTVDYLLQNGANIEARSSWGRPLYLATNMAAADIMTLLLKNGASVELSSSNEHETLLHLAISPNTTHHAFHREYAYDKRIRDKSRRAAAVKALLDHGLAVDGTDQYGRTPLIHAAAMHNIPAMQLLLRHGADINALDDGGGNALFHAGSIEQEGLDTFNWLLTNGARVDRVNHGNRNLLHANCNAEVVRILLAKKLDINLKDANGNTPLHFKAAHRRCKFPVVKLLIESGADPDAKNLAGVTPLHLVLARGQDREKISYFLEHVADPNAADDNGVTPLHVAVLQRGKEWTVTPLARKGAKIDARDKHGCTPLHWAVHDAPGTGILQALLAAGADPDAKNAQGQTPLHIAAATARRSLHIAPLLAAGARPDIKDNAGFYPFQIAALTHGNKVSAERLTTPGIAAAPMPDAWLPSDKPCSGSDFERKAVGWFGLELSN